MRFKRLIQQIIQTNQTEYTHTVTDLDLQYLLKSRVLKLKKRRKERKKERKTNKLVVVLVVELVVLVQVSLAVAGRCTKYEFQNSEPDQRGHGH